MSLKRPLPGEKEQEKGWRGGDSGHVAVGLFTLWFLTLIHSRKILHKINLSEYIRKNVSASTITSPCIQGGGVHCSWQIDLQSSEFMKVHSDISSGVSFCVTSSCRVKVPHQDVSDKGPITFSAEWYGFGSRNPNDSVRARHQWKIMQLNRQRYSYYIWTRLFWALRCVNHWL